MTQRPLPTQAEAGAAARVLLNCNGHDLTVWGGDGLHDDDAREALRALAAGNACPHCKGRGYVAGDPEGAPIEDCNHCDGTGNA